MNIEEAKVTESIFSGSNHIIPMADVQWDPMEHIGLGLTKEDAEKIKNYRSNNSEE